MTTTLPTQRPQGLNPVASPLARWIAMFFGLVFLALSGAAGRELWVRHFAPEYRSWADPFTEYIGHLSYHTWMLYAGIGCLVVGVLLLIPVFKPRSTTHRRLVDDENVWMRPVDIARMTTANAEKVSGVNSASTVVKHNQVRITVTTDRTDPTLADRVSRTVTPLLAQVAGGLELAVSVTNPAEASHE